MAGGDAVGGFVCVDCGDARSGCSLRTRLRGLWSCRGRGPGGAFSANGNYTEFLRRKQEFGEGQARQEQAVGEHGKARLAVAGAGSAAAKDQEQELMDHRSLYERMDELADFKARNAAMWCRGD